MRKALLGLPASATAVIGAAVVLGIAAIPVRAGVINDVLHGFCQATNGSQSAGSGCGSNGITFTTTSNPLSPFGFTRAPDDNSGLPATINFFVVDLVPNNAPNATSQTIIDTGHNTAITTPVTESLFSTTAWTSGDISTYLGLPRSGGPNNPISSLLSSTVTVDPGATGYFVYLSSFGQVTFGSNTDPFFTTSSSLPIGSLLFAIVEGGTPNSIQDSTANSSAILITTPAPPPSLPEPASLALLGSALAGLAFLSRRRHQS